jgi:hypothetical protein
MIEQIGPWTELAAKLDMQQAPKPASAAWDAWTARMDASNMTLAERNAATTVLIKLMKIRAERAMPAQCSLF